MDRRDFLAGAGAASLAVGSASRVLAEETAVHSLDTARHRFGVNYTPSRNWWFCWNDWRPDPIRRDLDAIAALGADHLRLMLIWPYFQPNLNWVSPAHLERFDQLLGWMGERRLDAVVTVFTGQLSGWYFVPPFQDRSDKFFRDARVVAAEELYVRSLAAVMRRHSNIIGFDLGNEINTCWQCDTTTGDAWMRRILALMRAELPAAIHVNGVDHKPWFAEDTFSAQALVREPLPVMHCYPFWTGAMKYGGAMDAPSVRLMAGMAALIRAFAADPRKPVWAGEFNTCIEQLPEQGQAEWLERAVTAAIEQGVCWFTYWDTHDVDRKFAFHPVEYSLGLLTNDGRVKEQGRAFQRLAAAYAGKPVTLPKGPAAEPPRVRTEEATWRWLLDWMSVRAAERDERG
jgi:hypothetical protein